MKPTTFVLAALGGLSLAACAKQTPPPAPPPPAPQGSIQGTTAADRDGDGVIDGYYTSDGIYHPNYAPPPLAPPAPSRTGERG